MGSSYPHSNSHAFVTEQVLESPPARAEWRVPEDIVDKAISAMLVVFLYFFFVGEKLSWFPIPVRIEDMLFVILVPMSYRYLARPKSPLFWWIALYFGINLIPYFAWGAVGDYNLSYYPIIIFKEMEYLYIAYIICVNRNKWVLHTVDALALMMIGYGVRALIRGEIGYYGIGSIGILTAPSLAGAVYLFSTIWLHIRSKLLVSDTLRRLSVLLYGAGSICVVATVSRSGILALFIYWTVYLFLTNLKLMPWLFTAAAAAGLVIMQVADATATGYRLIAATVIRRIAFAGAAAAERSNKWQVYLGEFSPADFVFGRGKGYPNARDKTIGMGVDSQYVRTIMESGFVGVLIVAIIFAYFLREIHRRGGEIEHALGVVLAMLVLSIPLEAMQVSKSGGFFWLVFVYLLMCQRKLDPTSLASDAKILR